MKISIITTMTNPEARKDPWKEAMNCYQDLGDEVIVTGNDWPEEFEWQQIGEYFQEGYNKASYDWVLRMDLDYFFHQKDLSSIIKFLKTNEDVPVVSFPQYQIFTPDRYQVKTKLCNAFNKKIFNKIKLNGGGDLCQPTLDGKQLLHKDFPTAKIPIYQYDSVFRTKEIISHDRARFARAWERKFKTFDDRGGPDQESAFDSWFQMVSDRYKYHVHKLNINNHPIYIQDKLMDLNDDQFGHSAFGLKNTTRRSYSDYLTGYKQKYL
jgi:hypothetical protein